MAAGLSFAASCAADSPDMGEEAVAPITGLASGATCPEASALSYDNFGREFFEAHCTKCHTAAISGAMREAPLDRNFDDVKMIRALAHQIDQQAGAGPKQQNQVMPPSGEAAKPTLEQRMQLAEWLSCGAP
ncbi:MAG TPA: c-type cytochrome [Polyangiales bacterium]|nr:c-type cytochrome [Polyangiales bacterium]